jgi:hypothetical protein
MMTGIVFASLEKNVYPWEKFQKGTRKKPEEIFEIHTGL